MEKNRICKIDFVPTGHYTGNLVLVKPNNLQTYDNDKDDVNVDNDVNVKDDVNVEDDFEDFKVDVDVDV